MKKKSAENVGEANLSGIFAHEGGSMAILSDDGTEFKKAVLIDSCEQLGIRSLYSNTFSSSKQHEN